MNDINVKALASIHNEIMIEIYKNATLISEKLFVKKGASSLVDGHDILMALASLNTVPTKVRADARRASRHFLSLEKYIESFTDVDQAAIAAIETTIRSTSGIKEQLEELHKLRSYVESENALSIGLDVAIEIATQGMDTIYNIAKVEKHLGLEKGSERMSDGGVLADDVAGALVGGVAGLALSYVTAGATVAGGAVTGAIMFSGNAIWVNIKAKWGPFVIHGPDDPNGPIGGWPDDPDGENPNR